MNIREYISKNNMIKNYGYYTIYCKETKESATVKEVVRDSRWWDCEYLNTECHRDCSQTVFVTKPKEKHKLNRHSGIQESLDKSQMLVNAIKDYDRNLEEEDYLLKQIQYHKEELKRIEGEYNIKKELTKRQSEYVKSLMG